MDQDLSGREPPARTVWGRRVRSLLVMSVASATAAALAAGTGVAGAQGGGGTAKPPGPTVAPFPTNNLADPAFSVNVKDIHGFDVTGFIQNATLDQADNTGADPRCPTVGANPSRFGGTVTVNGVTVTIPCNLIVQMPANTFRWADFMTSGNGLDLRSGPFPSFEMRLVGNVVGGPLSPGKLAGEHIAGLAFASQQSSNSGSGVIQSIDWSTGNIRVDTGNPASPSVLQINDPSGRFGRAQSPDPRLSVDDQNPTIHAGTGYPMCVPRTTTDPTVPGNADDPLCPQSNRPKPVNGVCRNFTNMAVLPKGGLLPPPVGAQVYCSQWVMDNPLVSTAWGDARQQAPFEAGDHIQWSGTLVHAQSGGGDIISVHTIEAQVGIFTQAGTQPSYLAIGAFGVGSADTALTAVSGVAQEPADRLFLEAETTDVQTPVDIYMTDVDPSTGAVRNRWVTPYEMTGENQLGNPSGGINTQMTGAQEQRIRIRTAKAPLGLLNQPSRDVRVVSRALCVPQATANQPLLDACLNNAPTVANGLKAGQYFAPTFEYIFPENVHQGDPIVPYDLWHLPALRNGEGSNAMGGATPLGPSVGALSPTPW